MFKIVLHRHPTSYLLGVVIFTVLSMLMYLHLSHAEAYAAAPQLTISLPAGGAQVTGHVGTKVHLSGSGFVPGNVQLYTTTSSDPTKCTATGTTGTPPTLTPFTPSTATAQSDGTFTLDSTWPSSAGATGSAYYMCAIASPASQSLSSNTFTVAAAPTATVTPTTIAAGQQVTITGANWLPAQTLTVAITFSNTAAVVVSDHALPNSSGNLAATLTIPATTPAGSYSLSVIADNEPTLRVIQNNAVTVTAAAPTATATATATPTTTATATAAVTSTASVVSATPTVAPTQQGGTTPGNNTGNTSNNNGTSGTSTFLLFLLGGLGILLVVVGIILFILYSRSR